MRPIPSVIAAICCIVVFSGAYLLFWIQPLVGQKLLPLFGGGASTWSVCLLFFQTALCVGYAYAHGLEQCRSRSLRACVHLILLTISVSTLIFAIRSTWTVEYDRSPVAQILALLSSYLGPPIVVLASTGPLVQSWYGRLFPEANPYRLYALSNMGAILALVGYVLVIHPRLGLESQFICLFVGFVVFASLFSILTWIAMSPMLLPTSPAKSSECNSEAELEGRGPLHAIATLLLPAGSSILLLSTTNHICQDLAPVPLLWVVPLGLFLLSFVIAFDNPRWYHRGAWCFFAILSLYIAAGFDHPQSWAVARWLYELNAWFFDKQLLSWRPEVPLPWRIAAHCVALFASCLVLHGELFRLRPTASKLTSYYLLISVGGAIGSAFVNLLAPLVFTSYLEWELCVVAMLLGVSILALGTWHLPRQHSSNSLRPMAIVKTGVALLLAGVLVELVILLQAPQSLTERSVEQSRSFYGALAVIERLGADSGTQERVLLHGSTVHGSQFIDSSRRSWPTTYYSESGGAGRVLNYLRDKPNLKVAIIGMGIGTLATYAEPNHELRFYEINPQVVSIAESHFSFLSTARERGVRVDTILGDAREVLSREMVTDGPRFDVIVLDAFSGDSIPIHLLTVEAFELYLMHLREDGSIAIHVSNRMLDLASVVVKIAEHLGVPSLAIESINDPRRGAVQSTWIVLSRNSELLKALDLHSMPVTAISAGKSSLWTDNHHSLWSVMRVQ